MAKQLIFNDQARDKLAKGADTLAQAVISTLGPKSSNVAISRKNQSPLIAHDGVTVAKSIIPLEDNFENVGATLLLEASSNTNDLVGDGTTTATLLANTLIQEGLKLTRGGVIDGVIYKKQNAMEIKTKLDQYAVEVEKKIEEKALKIKKGQVKKIALISSGTQEIADLVVEAVEKTGKGGLVMAGNSPTFESYIEHKEGMEFDNGYLSPYFVTNANTMTVNYDDALVLFADFVISDINVLTPLLENILKLQEPLIIIANDVVGTALSSLVQLKLKGQLKVCAIVAPEFADRRKEMLEDLAILTGGVVVSSDKGDKLENVVIADLGRASVNVSATHTMITPKNVDKAELDLRIDAIKKQMDNEENAFRKERLKDRVAKLSQGIAIVRVGGASEAEVNDKKLRIEDAIHAVRASIEDGIVAGGGVCLYEIAEEMFKDAESGTLEHLVYMALQAPFKTLLSNSGIESKDKEKIDYGYNVLTEDYVNMFDAGIIDPAKVTKLAVRHSFSIAGMFLTTSSVIVDIPEKDIQKMQIIQNG